MHEDVGKADEAAGGRAAGEKVFADLDLSTTASASLSAISEAKDCSPGARDSSPGSAPSVSRLPSSESLRAEPRLADAWNGLRDAAELPARGEHVKALAAVCRVARIIKELESEPRLKVSEDEVQRLREVYDTDDGVRKLAMHREKLVESHLVALEHGLVGRDEELQEPKLLLLEGDLLPKSVKDLMLPLESLESEYNQVHALLDKAFVFEALEKLAKVEAIIAKSVEAQEEADTIVSPCARMVSTPKAMMTENVLKRNADDVGSKIKDSVRISRLKDMNSRLARVIKTINDRPLNPKDSSWAHTTVKDKNISNIFQADIYLRFAQGGERKPNGPSAQLIVMGVVRAFPLGLTEFVSIYRETDLYRKEWLADCEKCEGSTGGPDKLYSAYSRIVNSSALLPRKLEIVTVREFATCVQAPINGYSPGVMVMDSAAPSGSPAEFAGWPIPGTISGCIRVQDIDTALYFAPNKDHPGTCDVFATAFFGAPIPQWLIPLSIVKKFFANHFMSLFKSIKLNIASCWDKLAYQERIQANLEFYENIMAIDGKS